MYKKIAVIGGDMRQIYLVDMLKKEGFEVKFYGFDKTDKKGEKNLDEAMQGAEAVILPLPVTQDGIYINAPLNEKKITVNEIAEKCKDCKAVFGGKIQAISNKFNSLTVDYMNCEDLAIRNAVPTAEGAINIVISELPITVFKMKCLITGYGKVAKALAVRLKALGAEVTVAARKASALAEIENEGYTPLCFKRLTESLSEYNCIFNTVPEKIFCRQEILNVRADALIIDLASKPGGIDLDEAASQNKKVIWALSLPGKTAPKTSGEIIGKTIIKILEENV